MRGQHDRHRDLMVGINVSAVQLREPGFPELVAGLTAEAGLPPESVCIELTEAVLFDAPGADVSIERISRDGFQIVLDDFGTGYSSLSYLRRFPVNVLKIDRSFVSELGRDAQSEAIVAATAAMAHALGIAVVAEGIETEEEYERVRTLGCSSAQGFYIARPAPPSTLVQTMDAWEDHRLADAALVGITGSRTG